ncbi:MAG: hypothetical protein K2N07_09695, partial [Desulfovibrio sp.]|nr:hypothetical protein [Desulfovibrio sp.]
LGTFALSSGSYDDYYKKALQIKAVIKDAFDAAFKQCNALLTPVAPTTAPRLGESLSDPLQMYLSDVYTVSVNLAGLPGLSMPCGFDGKGMPIGAQLIGPHFGEGVLLNTAPEFPGRPAVGSVYGVCWVFSQGKGYLGYLLAREVGTVNAEDLDALVDKLVERTDGIAAKYGNLWK